jgi:hypothetical protein
MLENAVTRSLRSLHPTWRPAPARSPLLPRVITTPLTTHHQPSEPLEALSKHDNCRKSILLHAGKIKELHSSETKPFAPSCVGSDEEPTRTRTGGTPATRPGVPESYQLGYEGVFAIWVKALGFMNPSLLSPQQPPHEKIWAARVL